MKVLGLPIFIMVGISMVVLSTMLSEIMIQLLNKKLRKKRKKLEEKNKRISFGQEYWYKSIYEKEAAYNSSMIIQAGENENLKNNFGKRPLLQMKQAIVYAYSAGTGKPPNKDFMDKLTKLGDGEKFEGLKKKEDELLEKYTTVNSKIVEKRNRLQEKIDFYTEWIDKVRYISAGLNILGVIIIQIATAT